MITDSYTALQYLLTHETAITDIVAKYPNSGVPVIHGGKLPEQSKYLPAVCFRVDLGQDKLVLDDQYFIVSCFAETERGSYLLAKAINNALDSKQKVADGYNCKINCRILGTNTDASNKESNTPIEIRIVN